MNTSTIDWPWRPLKTWNPVVGCKRGCKWGVGGCYARRTFYSPRYQSLKPRHEFEEVTFYPNRLLDSMPKKPAYVFVGSMSDIEYWHGVNVLEIIEICRHWPQHTFLYLSKNPQSYRGFQWPSNCILGLTLTCEQTQTKQIDMISRMTNYKRTFLSIEPLLGPLEKIGTLVLFEKIIVGAMTGTGAIPPKLEWVQSVRDNVPENILYFKSSMDPYLIF